MTCVAWDGKTLAADKQCEWDGRPNYTTKVFRIRFKNKIYLIGFSNSEGPALKFVEHFRKKGFENYPEVSGSNILIISKKDSWLIDADGFRVPMTSKIWTLGSGGDIALGAMVMGASAKEAVEIACKYNTGYGMGVDVVKF